MKEIKVEPVSEDIKEVDRTVELLAQVTELKAKNDILEQNNKTLVDQLRTLTEVLNYRANQLQQTHAILDGVNIDMDNLRYNIKTAVLNIEKKFEVPKDQAPS